MFERVVEALKAHLSQDEFIQFADELDNDSEDNFNARVCEEADRMEESVDEEEEYDTTGQ